MGFFLLASRRSTGTELELRSTTNTLQAAMFGPVTSLNDVFSIIRHGTVFLPSSDFMSQNIANMEHRNILIDFIIFVISKLKNLHSEVFSEVSRTQLLVFLSFS